MSEGAEQQVSLRIRNRLGLHARPAAEFVKVDLEVNGKSIMGVLMLAAEQGTEITIRASGDDASEALEALSDLVRRGFDEAYEE